MELYPELRLILAILTCYRLARLIANDDGPLFIFKRLQYWAKDKAYYEAEAAGMLFNVNPAANGPINDQHYGKWHSLAEGLSCPYCLGVWFSLPVLALVIWPTYYGDLFLILMSISGAQAFLWGIVSK